MKILPMLIFLVFFSYSCSMNDEDMDSGCYISFYLDGEYYEETEELMYMDYDEEAETFFTSVTMDSPIPEMQLPNYLVTLGFMLHDYDATDHATYTIKQDTSALDQSKPYFIIFENDGDVRLSRFRADESGNTVVNIERHDKASKVVEGTFEGLLIPLSGSSSSRSLLPDDSVQVENGKFKMNYEYDFWESGFRCG